MYYAILIALIIAVLIVLGKQNSKNGTKSAYKYIAKKHLMTKREEEFFTILCEIFEQKCYVVPQVHLSAILEHKVKGQNWRGAFSHINGKSVDYVLLRRKDLSILCAVELDDSTHNVNKRKERDEEVDRIFKHANIPLVRFKKPETMTKQEIVDTFAEVINR